MKKRFLNIIFYLLLIFIVILFIVNNKDNSVIFKRKIINDLNSFNKYKDYNYVTLDLKNAKESRFSVSDNDKIKDIVYVVSYGEKNLLLLLNPTTVLTNKVNVIHNKDDINTRNLKEDLEYDNYVNGYYSNNNLFINEEIVKLKLYISLGLICLFTLGIIFNIITLIIVRKQ